MYRQFRNIEIEKAPITFNLFLFQPLSFSVQSTFPHNRVTAVFDTKIDFREGMTDVEFVLKVRVCRFQLFHDKLYFLLNKCCSKSRLFYVGFGIVQCLTYICDCK